MIKKNLIAERTAIESYREMIAYLAEKDPTSQRMLKEILAVEEGHAYELAAPRIPFRVWTSVESPVITRIWFSIALILPMRTVWSVSQRT